MKKVLKFIAVLFLAVALIGCSKTEDTPKSGETENEPLKVAYLATDIANPIVVETSKRVKEICDANGYEYIENQYGTDVSKLIDTLENYILSEQDIVILQSAGGEAVNDVANRMKEAGIILISYDDPDHVGTYYLTQSDEEIGTKIGEAAAAYCNEHCGGTADCVAITYDVLENIKIRADYMCKAYEENCQGKCLYRFDEEPYASDYAAITDAIVNTYPDIRIVMTIADEDNIFLEEGLKGIGLEDAGYVMFGCDTVEEIRNKWINGEKTCSVASVWTYLPESIVKAVNMSIEDIASGTVRGGEIHQEVAFTTPENVKEVLGLE